LRQHPALLVEWLRLLNSLSRWREEGSKTVPLVLSALAVVIMGLLVSLSRRGVGAIQTLAEYWVLLAVVSAIYAVTSVSGRRRRLEELKSQSWLIATPIPPRSLLISHAIRVLLPLFVIAATLVIFPALVAMTNEGVDAAAQKAAGAAAGVADGAAAGAWGRRLKMPPRILPKMLIRRSP